MALDIDTFSNVTGGHSFFKAVGHPLTAERIGALVAKLAEEGPVALYDPLGLLRPFAAIHDLSPLTIAGVFVQNIEKVGETLLGHSAQPVTAMPSCGAATVLAIAFDADKPLQHIRHLLPAEASAVSLDAVRLPDAMLTDTRSYLNKLNFATNFAFFREKDGLHTRLVTANYWSGYGAQRPYMWLRLLGEDGATLAEWTEALPGAGATVVLDSAVIARRFGLAPFIGQLFVHVVGAAGHDVVKYALDTYGDAETELSCTHDANAWPSDLYAGVPAPAAGETVLLWVQNSHPAAIPAGTIGLGRMGEDKIERLDVAIPAFGTYALDVASLLPGLKWPDQIEVHAGKHFVRPRYEVLHPLVRDGEGEGEGEAAPATRRRIAHANVERSDLKGDPKLKEVGNLLGKGFILPAPVLPLARFRSLALATPMSTAQLELPLSLAVYDADGTLSLTRSLGLLPRNHATALDIGELLGADSLPSGYGHMELMYDFSAGGENSADGWMHGLFRYEQRASGHGADTSFGAHMFNSVLTYKGEPQSYSGPAPGLSTRLFLRLGPSGTDTHCHLVYAASTPWHARSDTALQLQTADGKPIAERRIRIACSGSHYFRYRETFTREEQAAAGEHAAIIIRDTGCRLFGYHGLVREGVAFSLDHMFGF